MSNLPPPPTPPRHAARRPDTKSTSVYTDKTPVPTGEKPSWKDGFKAKSKVWGSVALEKGIKISDQLGAKVNNYAEKVGLCFSEIELACGCDVHKTFYNLRGWR
jgi:hypothetical protein